MKRADADLVISEGHFNRKVPKQPCCATKGIQRTYKMTRF